MGGRQPSCPVAQPPWEVWALSGRSGSSGLSWGGCGRPGARDGEPAHLVPDPAPKSGLRPGVGTDLVGSATSPHHVSVRRNECPPGLCRHLCHLCLPGGQDSGVRGLQVPEVALGPEAAPGPTASSTPPASVKLGVRSGKAGDFRRPWHAAESQTAEHGTRHAPVAEPEALREALADVVNVTGCGGTSPPGEAMQRPPRPPRPRSARLGTPSGYE